MIGKGMGTTDSLHFIPLTNIPLPSLLDSVFAFLLYSCGHHVTLFILFSISRGSGFQSDSFVSRAILSAVAAVAKAEALPGEATAEVFNCPFSMD